MKHFEKYIYLTWILTPLLSKCIFQNLIHWKDEKKLMRALDRFKTTVSRPKTAIFVK